MDLIELKRLLGFVYICQVETSWNAVLKVLAAFAYIYPVSEFYSLISDVSLPCDD